MRARRAVAAATTARARRTARARVHDAKLALGERGRAWWLPRDADADRPRISATIRALLSGRTAGASICPSDVARVVGGKTWRQLLSLVRAVAVTMAATNELDICRAGRPVRTRQTEGVLRYRLRTAG